MNALLIYPEYPDTYWSFRHALAWPGKKSAYPPLGLLTVAAMLPAHWTKRVVDMNVRPLRDSDLEWADIALFSGMLIQKESMLQALRRCRDRGLRTVVGGPVTNAADLAQHADHVVMGEAEAFMGELAAALENGTAQPVYRRGEFPPLCHTPPPDLSLIKLRRYSSMAVQYSRGCPYNCEFCDIIELYGRKPRTKSIEQVLTELEQLYESGWRGAVFFVDDNFIGNKRNVKQLLPALSAWNASRRHPFTFFTEASINLADDTELLEMMRAARFMRVFVGIETPSEAGLVEAGKLHNTRRSLLESVRRIQSYGMEVMAGFIVGFDSDTEEVFDQQVKFIEESAIPIAMVGLLTALPGTQLYRRLKTEGRLLASSIGDNLSCQLSFLPKMDAARLVEGYRSILTRIYDHKAYYERVRRFLRHCQPPPSPHRPFSDYLALARSILHQGLLGRARWSYWKLMLTTAARRRRALGTAVTLAIMGHHFQVVTENVCEPES